MARARNADKAAESAQEAREVQDMSQGVHEAERTPDGIQGSTEGAQELPDEMEVIECVLREYAVTGCEALNLRAEPVLDAPVAAVLPRGAGVFEDGEPGPEGWLHVRTGRLEGWMMAKYLEPLPLPEWPAQATGKLPYGAE